MCAKVSAAVIVWWSPNLVASPSLQANLSLVPRVSPGSSRSSFSRKLRKVQRRFPPSFIFAVRDGSCSAVAFERRRIFSSEAPASSDPAAENARFLSFLFCENKGVLRHTEPSWACAARTLSLVRFYAPYESTTTMNNMWGGGQVKPVRVPLLRRATKVLEDVVGPKEARYTGFSEVESLSVFRRVFHCFKGRWLLLERFGHIISDVAVEPLSL